MSALNDRCRQVDALTWEGGEFAVGQQITFRYTAWSDGAATTERAVGEITELWLESWRGVDDLAYAETDCDGVERRCWFHRDEAAAASDLEAEAGAAPEGALW